MASQKTRQFTELAVEIATNHGTATAFCGAAELDKSRLSRLLNGQMRRIDPELVAKIESATKRRVGMPEFQAYFKRLTRKSAGT